MKKQASEKSIYTLADILQESKYQKDFITEDNINEIEERLDELAEYLDRELTEHEEVRILEIVDEYTPKDKDGDYLTDLLPFDYAWKIYEAKKDAEWKRIVASW